MTYPKPFMSIKELVAFTGLPENYFLTVYRHKDNDFAGKMNPSSPSSKIIFDTERFDKWRTKHIKMEVAAMPHRKGCIS